MAKCLYFRQSMTNPEQVYMQSTTTAQQQQQQHAAEAIDAIAAVNINNTATSSSSNSSSSSSNHNSRLVHNNVSLADSIFGLDNTVMANNVSSSSVASSSNTTSTSSSSCASNSGGNDNNRLPANLQNLFSFSPASYSTGGASEPNLSDAILETDIFLRSIGLSEDSSNGSLCKIEVEASDLLSLGNGNSPFSPPTSSSTATSAIRISSVAPTLTSTIVAASSGNPTPTNASPIVTPKQGSPAPTVAAGPATTIDMSTLQLHLLQQQQQQQQQQQEIRKDDNVYLSEVSSNCSSISESNGSTSSWHKHVIQPDPLSTRGSGPFRNLSTGLDPIPEDSVCSPPTVYQPLVPPMVTTRPPTTTSYNISFPTTLQPRERFADFWARTGFNQQLANQTPSPGGGSSSVPPSPGSISKEQSPFHGALRSGPWDEREYQPMNVVVDESSKPAATAASVTPSGEPSPRKSKPTKRSRRNTPTSSVAADEEDMDDGASSRQRRKSTVNIAENKRRDCIKSGLESLQRVLPNLGRPEEEKISQASVLHEAAKYIREVKAEEEKVSLENEAVRKQIDELNNQIETFQSMLPANGAPLLPKVMTMRTLADNFHDHVVARTKDNWRYWVFVNIMGHFVHSFDQQVVATTFEDLQTTSLEYIGNNLSLHQLRKDAYRKLAKLCAKTSIVENPSKLPEEALGFVTRGERAYGRKAERGGTSRSSPTSTVTSAHAHTQMPGAHAQRLAPPPLSARRSSPSSTSTS